MPFNFSRTQQKLTRNTCPQRRHFLKLGVAATTSLIIPDAFGNSSTGTPADTAERKLSLLNLHTGESLNTTYWAEGEYQADELAAINHVLRDHRTGDIHTMDKNLLDLLNTLHHKMDAKQPFQIISGYRSAKTNKALNQKSSGVAKKSLHMQGKAIDIRLASYQLSDLRKAAIACQAGGVGYYPDSNFLHIDTGRVRRWG